jgi:predicted MFS family arabinose efflux permease
LVDRLFGSKSSGFAFAVVTNGTSIGFIVLSPIWLWLQPQVPWTQAFVSTGLVLLAASLVVWYASKKSAAAGLAGAAGATEPQFSAWRQVRSDKGFYALAIGFFGCGATMAFIDVHLVAFWQGASAPRALMGLSLSVLGLLELISGVATGWLAMRYKKHALLSIFYLLRCGAMLMLLVPNPMVYTLVFAVVFGASYLGTVVLTSVYCLERYGLRIKGQAFGMLFLVHQVGAFVSVQLGAISYDQYGNYVPVIVLLCLLTVIGALSARLVLRAPVSVEARTGYGEARAS